MTRPAMRAAPEDHVVRWRRIQARHPGVRIWHDPLASLFRQWCAAVPGFETVTADDLGRVLDAAGRRLAALGVHAENPLWWFEPLPCGQWRATGPGRQVITGPSLARVAAQARWRDQTRTGPPGEVVRQPARANGYPRLRPA